LIKKMNIVIIFIITFCYTNRALIYNTVLDNLPYVLTIIGIGLNIAYLIIAKVKRNLIIFYLFITWGLVLFFIGISRMGLIVSALGYVAFFLNLLLWVLIYNNSSDKYIEKYFNKYLYLILSFGIVNAVLGVYQYFIDPSIFGLAFHEIYGNVELFESGRIVKRATGLVGSPQNYSLLVAVTTALVLYLKFNKNMKFLLLLIAISGGLVSGSRAYSLFVIILVLFIIVFNLLTSRKNRGKVIKIIFTSFLLFPITLLIMSANNISNETFSRLFVFFNDWPALQVYLNNLRDVSWISFLVGNGLGYNERLVATFFNILTYKSFESYILSLFMQGGIISLIFFVLIYTMAIRNTVRTGEVYLFSFLFALLPNLLSTPSFNGMAMSFLIWPLIIYSLMCHRKTGHSH
jgi:hypothetical protein